MFTPDAQAKLELTLHVALMLVQQRHLYPQGLIEEQEERAGDILVELLRNFTPRPEWLENWGKESVSAAAHDPAERVRIAKLAAKARWRGHVKAQDTKKAQKTILTLAHRMRTLKKGYKPDNQIHIPILSVCEKTKNEVKAKTGIDISDYTHKVTEESVRHMLNGHEEVKDDELKRIPDIMTDWDKLTVIKRKKGITLKHEKAHNGDNYILIERVSSQKPEKLHIKTLYFVSFYRED